MPPTSLSLKCQVLSPKPAKLQTLNAKFWMFLSSESCSNRNYYFSKGSIAWKKDSRSKKMKIIQSNSISTHFSTWPWRAQTRMSRANQKTKTPKKKCKVRSKDCRWALRRTKIQLLMQILIRDHRGLLIQQVNWTINASKVKWKEAAWYYIGINQ